MNFLLSLFICTAIGNTKQAGRVGGQQWESQLLLKEDKKEIKRHLAMKQNPNNDLDDSIYVMEEAHGEMTNEELEEHEFCSNGEPIRTLDECNNYLRTHKQDDGADFLNDTNDQGEEEAMLNREGNEFLDDLCFFQTQRKKIFFGSNYANNNGSSNHRVICKNDCENRDQASCSSHENCKWIEHDSNSKCKFRGCEEDTEDLCVADSRCYWKAANDKCKRKRRPGKRCNDNAPCETGLVCKPDKFKLCCNEDDCDVEDENATIGADPCKDYDLQAVCEEDNEATCSWLPDENDDQNGGKCKRKKIQGQKCKNKRPCIDGLECKAVDGKCSNDAAGDSGGEEY